MKSSFLLLLIANCSFLIVSCRHPSTMSNPQAKIKPVVHPAWSYNSNIYEVNIRQFSPKGDFKGVMKHLQRLKNMNVDILWLMPVHPIGVKNRKGSMGSYYSVKDYLAVSPDYGTMDDFKALVNKAHAAWHARHH